MATQHFDVVVIGSGPAGLAAAAEAASCGASVAIVERQRQIGGECVHRGTIPSKTLRETAVQLARMKRSATGLQVNIGEQAEVAMLMSRLDDVVAGHVAYMTRIVERSQCTLIHGKASFVTANELRVDRVREDPLEVTAKTIVVAVGSRPRNPPDVPIDHENVLDSDSILSMIYLPESLTILGSGVIACEWASVFNELGVHVTIIDRAPTPMGFLDRDLSARFVESFEASGSLFMGSQPVANVAFDGVSSVVTTLACGSRVTSRKLLCALGRVANIASLNIDAVGLATTKRGHLEVDEHGRANGSNIYAVGDVIGFPALAATSMDQGRRAVRHALTGNANSHSANRLPVGIFTIPELSSIGLTEEAAREEFGSILVGHATFDEVARGHVSGITDGFVKLIVHPLTGEILGVHIAGDGATELLGIGQIAMAGGMRVGALIENIFNFPTLGEAYRIAALDVVRQQELHRQAAAE